MRVVVIGGTGFLGPEVVQQLVAASCDVAIFHRGVTEPPLPPSVRHFHGDRGELAMHRSAFRSFDPDVVVDMRPMTEEHARQLVSTFAGLAERSVVVSSADVYRAYGRLNLTEPGPPDPSRSARTHRSASGSTPIGTRGRMIVPRASSSTTSCWSSESSRPSPVCRRRSCASGWSTAHGRIGITRT